MLVTSHRKKDLVVTKVARLGRSSCRLLGEAGQNVSLVQKLGVWYSHDINQHGARLPQLYQGKEPAGNLLPLSSRQLGVKGGEDEDEVACLPKLLNLGCSMKVFNIYICDTKPLLLI